MIRFPAEWEPQAALVMAWPHPTGDFRNLSAVEGSYRAIVAAVTRFQPLIVLCRDAAHQEHIAAQLPAGNARLHFVQVHTNDMWVRDTVFLTVEQDDSASGFQLLNFRFNGWGNKYPHEDDNALNQVLFAHPIFAGLSHTTLDLVLEGGSLESDGQGTLLSTKNCLFNPNRNPHLSEQEIARQLQQSLGATRILWLEQSNLAGDDTDAHVDTLARFCAADVIAYTSCDNPADPHYQGLKNMEAQLRALRTASGAAYQLVPLPLPQPMVDEEGEPLPANYANFLIINGAVLGPTYDDPMDAVALERLAACFPQREIVPLPCRPLVHQYGSLHCASMQIPAFVPLNLL